MFLLFKKESGLHVPAKCMNNRHKKYLIYFFKVATREEISLLDVSMYWGKVEFALLLIEETLLLGGNASFNRF